MKIAITWIFASALLWQRSGPVVGQETEDALVREFQTPPNSARPLVWWHWMNGNITKVGIKLDLEWMHRIGLAGFQVFDISLPTPQVVPKRLLYMTPEWKDAFKYATVLADRLGLEQGIAGSPGWSESGGPWVHPAGAMKKYVWSTTCIAGGRPFRGRLLHPPTNTGAFQNLPRFDVMQLPAGSAAIPDYYQDAKVIAYRRPATDVSLASLRPTMTASGGNPDYSLLTDSDLVNETMLPLPAKLGEKAWIQYSFADPQTVRAITWVTDDFNVFQAQVNGFDKPIKTLESSDDGVHFQTVVTLPNASDNPYEYLDRQRTVAFAPVTAKYFRVTFERVAPHPVPGWAGDADPASFGIAIRPPAPGFAISELVLHAGARVDRWEAKAAFSPAANLDAQSTPYVAARDAVAKSNVVDVTSLMHPDGTLIWTPPPGDWVVLRFGYSLLGVTNHPAIAQATGLEVDKLGARFVKRYTERYLETFKDAVGAELMGRRGVQAMVTDSWEAGSQNWTDRILQEFQKRRGYDPAPWMPVLVGQVVESATASDRFLWDFRSTIGELTADSYYGELARTLHASDMVHYSESHEAGRAFVGDGMRAKKFSDVPMGAFYAELSTDPQYRGDADTRESASTAHIYGQNIAAAESFTVAGASWDWTPSRLKPFADQEFLNGINRLVIHESTHQPEVDRAPGMTLGTVGQYFSRNETWAEQAGAWVDYLARSSFLLQRGRFVADVVYFYGEDTNLTASFANRSPAVPTGYSFDYINSDGLIHELSVTAERVVSRSGMSYRLLALDPSVRYMTLPVLRAIQALVKNGAALVGPKPLDAASLADDIAEFRQLSDELFGDGSGTHRVGRGIVFAGSDIQKSMEALDVAPDLSYPDQLQGARLRFVHRKLDDGDIYFVNNRCDCAGLIQASFRMTGKVPEIWRAEDGRMDPVSFSIADGRTTVPLKLEPWDAVFVVFRRSTTATVYAIPASTENRLAALDGPWRLTFQPGRGAPPSVNLPQLRSWSTLSTPGVKYFSGTGTYTATFSAQSEWRKAGAHLWLDLGQVRNLAHVTLNGHDLGVVWHAPYRVEITAALNPGKNQVSIAVVNSWTNRFIGDKQPGLATPITFGTLKPDQSRAPLEESGLLGPVVLSQVESE